MMGTPVTALRAGVVEDIGNESGYGHYVVVKHTRVDGSNFWTQYAHLDPKLIVSDGSIVSRGSWLGMVGRSGNVTARTPTNLHFEIRTAHPARAGLLDRVDPTPFLCISGF